MLYKNQDNQVGKNIQEMEDEKIVIRYRCTPKTERKRFKYIKSMILLNVGLTTTSL